MVAVLHVGRLVTLLLFGLTACAPPEPVRIGFLGGLSGRVADLGIGGRNGATLAVELRNRNGGIDGRQIELIAEDDQQDPLVARQAVTRLIDRKVAAIVGPMTSAMAVATLPLANAAGMLMMSPTATTTALSGIDDHFMRAIAPTTEYAMKSAQHHFRVVRSRRVAVAYDLRNRAYTESWLKDFRSAFEAEGGVIATTSAFSSGDETQFGELAAKIVGGDVDTVLLIANSVDAALLAQQVRRLAPKLHLSTSEWAATERLIELGGKAVEGVVIAQFLDREGTQPAYVAFRKTYVERFGQEPGFAGLTAFDATNVVLDALAGKRPEQTLKQAILARRTFAGAQSAIDFDANGDARRETHLTTIRNGAFVSLH